MTPLDVWFDVPTGTTLLSMNDRDHWRSHALRVRWWRAAAHRAGLRIPGDMRPTGPVTVTVVLPVADRRVRDPHNYFATVKPIIDGLTDAGLWPDDGPDHVTTTEPRLVICRHPAPRRVTVEIQDRA